MEVNVIEVVVTGDMSRLAQGSNPGGGRLWVDSNGFVRFGAGSGGGGGGGIGVMAIGSTFTIAASSGIGARVIGSTFVVG